jgi:hypothetical protein
VFGYEFVFQFLVPLYFAFSRLSGNFKMYEATKSEFLQCFFNLFDKNLAAGTALKK